MTKGQLSLDEIVAMTFADRDARQAKGSKHVWYIDTFTGAAWHRPTTLLGTDNAKTEKGEELGWETAILYLAPASISGRNVCAMSSEGCRFACLFSAGRGDMITVFLGRLNKTFYLYCDRAGFLAQLEGELDALNVRAASGEKIAVRLNGTSDLPWHLWLDMSKWSSLVFYDYTKYDARFRHELPANYSLTFSRSEENEGKALEVLANGGNVAIVFADDELPADWHGYPLVVGDSHDLRFLDPKGGYVVGLTAKGEGKKDESGFVVKSGRSLPVLQRAA